MITLTLRKAARRAISAVRRLGLRARDSIAASYEAECERQLASLIPAYPSPPISRAAAAAVALFRDHRFDTLGSGWVAVHHGMECRGFDGQRFPPVQSSQLPASRLSRTNRREADRIFSLTTAPYRPIDWQIDTRSGFRWSEATWYRDVRYGKVAGADVKVPWELSRLQHLADFALAFASTKDPSLVPEYRNQVLDWIAHNPPRFGVNWACTMDVGIRTVNLLVAYDLFRSSGAVLDSQFERVLAASIYAHARHVVRNLEWSETGRANHYLANVVGLLYAAAYLPASEETDAWLLFAIQELIAEAEYQFLADGGHFEASTAYHGLCGEMLAVAALLVRALPAVRVDKMLARASLLLRYGPGLRRDAASACRLRYRSTGELLPRSFFATLRRAAQLTQDITRSDGSVPLIGDDDSGRILRLGGWIVTGNVAHMRATYENLVGFTDLPDDAVYPRISDARQQQWLAMASALYGCDSFVRPELSHVWDHSLALAKALGCAPITCVLRLLDEMPLRAQLVPSGGRERLTVVAGELQAAGVDLLADATHIRYPHFGLYVLRSLRLLLVIRCGPAMQDGAGVHAHEDQLSVDLTLDGRTVIRDPGSYVYTAAPASRAAYRSSYAHNAPATFGPGFESPRAVFSPPRQTDGSCAAFGDGLFVGHAAVGGGSVTRRVRVFRNCIAIEDSYALQQAWRPASLDPFASARPVACAPAYGVRYATIDVPTTNSVALHQTNRSVGGGGR